MSTKVFSASELAQRLNIRKDFSDVDGPALLATAKPNGVFSKSPLPIYPIPMKTSGGSESFIEFGPIHYPDFVGLSAANDTGMVLWCSCPDGQRFVDLAIAAGAPTATSCCTERGTIIDLDKITNNYDVIELSMKVFQTLVNAFDITSQDTALFEHDAMDEDDEILEGNDGTTTPTL